jgi:hypothetical protein
LVTENGRHIHAFAAMTIIPDLMRWFRDNGLTIALLMLFLVSIGVMGLAGWGAHNQDLLQHGNGTLM